LTRYSNLPQVNILTTDQKAEGSSPLQYAREKPRSYYRIGLFDFTANQGKTENVQVLFKKTEIFIKTGVLVTFAECEYSSQR
jgi:hypothetical protein